MTTLSDRVYYGVPANAIKIMKLRIPAIHQFRAMQLAQNGYSTLNSLIGADIKEYVESYITEKNVRAKQSQIRRAKEIGRVLKTYFTQGDTVLDPFAGSGTALIEANVLGMNSIGIELSPFNVLIQEVKAKKYNIPEYNSNLRWYI